MYDNQISKQLEDLFIYKEKHYHSADHLKENEWRRKVSDPVKLYSWEIYEVLLEKFKAAIDELQYTRLNTITLFIQEQGFFYADKIMDDGRLSELMYQLAEKLLSHLKPPYPGQEIFPLYAAYDIIWHHHFLTQYNPKRLVAVLDRTRTIDYQGDNIASHIGMAVEKGVTLLPLIGSPEALEVLHLYLTHHNAGIRYVAREEIEIFEKGKNKT